MKARDVMSRPVVSVHRDTTLREAITLLTERGYAGLPVVDELGQVIGTFTEADAVRLTMTAADGTDHRDQPVVTGMSTPVEVVHPNTDVATVAERMVAGRLRCMPVVEHGLLVGVVARRDLLRTMVRDDDVIAAHVRALLDEYAGSRRRWDVEVDGGRVAVAGEFADDAERTVIAALARTAAGVLHVELRTAAGLSLAWDD